MNSCNNFEFTRNWIVSDPKFCSDLLNPALGVSPWSGHRNFAYDLVSFIRPNRIVELGTHYGCSFFAFLQASKDLTLTTEHVAVDTWTGEDHAGRYGEEVFELVNQTIQQCFESENVRILRKTFDEALEDIPNESVDLLHIDGFHSYDAVSHDYLTWLPKLSNNGIVLFHDVSPSSGYGSSDFWSEIKKEFPHFEFIEHSFGLGILFPKGSESYFLIKKFINDNTLELYKFKAEFQLRDRQYKDAQNMLEERWTVMQSMEAMIRDRDAEIENQRLVLNKRATTSGATKVLISAIIASLRYRFGKVFGRGF